MMTSLSSAVGSWQLCGLFAWDEAELQHELEDQDNLLHPSYASEFKSGAFLNGCYPCGSQGCQFRALCLEGQLFK